MKHRWLLLLLAWAGAAQAHIASNGFLVAKVHGQEISGSIELAVRDVELAIGVDTNQDGKVTWGELRSNAPRLLQYVRQHLFFSAQDGSLCPEPGRDRRSMTAWTAAMRGCL